ncbi:MAG: glycosyltransferase [Flavobacteriales bacterium]|nr:glycosyltransferase [Flavobacteriales bacterium]
MRDIIAIYHDTKVVVEVYNSKIASKIEIKGSEKIVNVVKRLAFENPNHLIIWVNIKLKDFVDFSSITSLFDHDKLMLSYSVLHDSYFGDNLDYIDTTTFMKINRSVRFPTWQMSSDVGGLHASVFNSFFEKSSMQYNNDSFDYFLVSICKLSMLVGILGYSEPKLINMDSKEYKLKASKVNYFELFKFVKNHFKPKWTFLLLWFLSVYNKKFKIIEFLSSLKYSHIELPEDFYDDVQMKSCKSFDGTNSIDVLIPTIGRKQPLHDVLKDLSKQSVLPKRVIIIEQNPLEGSVSELEYLSYNWPFSIIHEFTRQTGACNARNMALAYVKSDWVFFADDDIRIETDFISDALKVAEKTGNEAFTFYCYQKGEKKVFNKIIQWGNFGSCSGLVRKDKLQGLSFDLRYEFRYGEDTDFGMQLINSGVDVLYAPEPSVFHLKAPIGGFRSKFIQPWDSEKIGPKPSPAIMLNHLKYYTLNQLRGYKTLLFIKIVTNSKTLNSVLRFRKQWERSKFWANKLLNQIS